jgi:hypothetical protein
MQARTADCRKRVLFGFLLSILLLAVKTDVVHNSQKKFQKTSQKNSEEDTFSAISSIYIDINPLLPYAQVA